MNMKTYLATPVLFILSVIAVSAQSFPVFAQIIIATQGKSTFTVVIPADAPVSVQNAAQELQKDIEISTGAKLSLQKDNIAVATPLISLGDTQQAKSAGIDCEKLTDAAFRIITKNGNLYITGIDTPDGKWTKDGGVSNGTANGVYTFLEDYLDVRWLMPGNLGRDVPVKSTFGVDAIDRTETPTFSLRNLSHLGDYAEGTQLRNINQWEDHQKLGYSIKLNKGHNWWRTINGGKNDDVNTAAVKELYKEHPDWFAMDASGERPYPKTHAAKLESTNPGFVHWFAEKAIQTLKDYKTASRPMTFPLSPSDGRGWSQSPESKALYDPIPEGQQYPSMSSLVLTWYHDVAQIVAKEYPAGRLAGFLYADYVYPPTKVSMKLPPNFTPVICGVGTYGYGLYNTENQQKWKTIMDSWAKVVPGDWFYFDLPNQFLNQDGSEIGKINFPGSTGLISPAAPEILNVIFSNLVKNHIKGAYIYGVPSWGNAALANYITAKMLWNPRLNAGQLQQEWLNRAYGARAGAAMELFYQKLNGWVGDYYRANPGTGSKISYDMLKNIYAAHWGEMEKLFLTAKSQPMTAMQQQRLKLIEDNMIVLQWRLRNAGFLPLNFASSLTRSNQQVIDLLSQKDEDFPLFPGLLPGGNYPYPKAPKWTVKLGEISQDTKKVLPKLDAGMFLIYTSEDMKMRVMPQNVKQAAYFASYQLMDQAGKKIESGILGSGIPITWDAKANTAYYLYIPPWNRVNYELSIDNATMANATLQENEVTLSGKPLPVHVFYTPQSIPIGAYDDGNSVIIKKPFSGAMAKTIMGEAYYTNARVLSALDEDWRFSPDPKNDGLQRGVINAGFDDSSWKTVSALSWWQMQGFPDYHGDAWYRIKFTAPQLSKTDAARIYFGAVDGNAVVYLNGKKISEHILGANFKGWDVPFSFGITKELQAGENILAVKVTSKSNDSASGIFRGVSVVAGTRR